MISLHQNLKVRNRSVFNARSGSIPENTQKPGIIAHSRCKFTPANLCYNNALVRSSAKNAPPAQRGR